MSLESKWEKFRGGAATQIGNANGPRVTINRKGLIYLNGWAYKMFGSPKAVALYYSCEDDSIAVEPAYPRFSENFLVVKKQMGGRYTPRHFAGTTKFASLQPNDFSDPI